MEDTMATGQTNFWELHGKFVGSQWDGLPDAKLVCQYDANDESSYLNLTCVWKLGVIYVVLQGASQVLEKKKTNTRWQLTSITSIAKT